MMRESSVMLIQLSKIIELSEINSNDECLINREYTPGFNGVVTKSLKEKFPLLSVMTSPTNNSSVNSI